MLKHDHFQDPNIVKMLWTSGWDSTFRLLQLVVEQKRKVLPIYIITDRGGTFMELKAIKKIKKLTYQLFPHTVDLILPTYFFDVNDLTASPEEAEKYNALLQQSYLGSQYIWLSKFARHQGIKDLELSIHSDDTAYRFIKNFVVKQENQYGPFYMLDPALSDENPLSLFKPFRFPLLEWSKVKMKEHALKIGTYEIMNLTWFCHKPKNGKPCGRCNPCKYSIEEGMAFRFPKSAMLRYRLDSVYEVGIKTLKFLHLK